MRLILTVAALVLTTMAAPADDSVKDFVRYQQERLRSYDDAQAYHAKDKLPVIVFVGITDGDELFATWKKVRDDGYCVFVTEFPNVFTGVVVGKDHGGQFSRFDIKNPHDTDKIKAACCICQGGKCEKCKNCQCKPKVEAAPVSFPVLGGCPNGRCPNQRSR